MEQEGFFKAIGHGIQDMCYIWAKEMRNAFSDEGVLIFCILVPIFYPLVYSWIYNNEVVRDVPVAIVDMSHSHLSREFIRDYDASPDTKVAYYCDNLEEAKQLAGRNAVHGVLYFPEDFEKRIYRSETSNVSTYADMSLMLYYRAVYSTAVNVANKINSKIQISRSTDFTNQEDKITASPIKSDNIAIFNEPGGYGNAIIPGVLMLILQQTLLLGIGLSAGTARENNRYKELVPISKHYMGTFRIILGKAMTCFMTYCIQAAYITLCVPHFFNFTEMSTPMALWGLLVPYILAVTFFGMTLSCFVRYRENVLLLVIFTSVPFLFMTGVSWPLSNIPGFWEGVACLIPSTWGIRAFISINNMGATLDEVQKFIIPLWIQVIVYGFTTFLVYRYQLNLTKKQAYAAIENIKNKAVAAKTEKDISKETSDSTTNQEETVETEDS
ncbi:MAG: ABC transporter permease [Prevotella sp.]|jgi:ABC-2 type transport system permease protein